MGTLDETGPPRRPSWSEETALGTGTGAGDPNGQRPDVEQQADSRLAPRPKRRVRDPPAEVSIEWLAFNYPSIMDVLMSDLKCRKNLNCWYLLAAALGKIAGSSAGKKDIQVQQAGGGKGFVIPSIRLPNGDIYYPPTPKSSWSNTKFQLTKAQRVLFPNANIARKYTLIQFLQSKHEQGFNTYLGNLLREEGFQYEPRIPSDGPILDLLRMIVFYDNDHRIDARTRLACAVPMAVCLLLHKDQVVFALLDDFGAVIRETTHRFTIQQRMTRRRMVGV